MKKLVSLMLILTLCIGLLSGVVAFAEGETATFVQVTDGNLTSGKYVLVDAGGFAPAYLDGTWVLTALPVIEDNKVTDSFGAVWTLTVEDDLVVLTDCNGVSISPKGGNTNGIVEGEYQWKWTFENGTFTFDGIDTDTVRLAGNVQSDNKYRGYKMTTVTGNYADKYPSNFTLYKLEESTTPPTTEPVVPPTTEPVVPPTTEPVVPPTTEPVVPPTTEPVTPPTTEPVTPPDGGDVPDFGDMAVFAVMAVMAVAMAGVLFLVKKQTR